MRNLASSRLLPPCLGALAAVALVLAASPVHADDRGEAKKHFQSGKQHHDAGEWDAALGEYLRAYQLDTNPAFLFNIAQIYRLKGERGKAVDYYQRYLEAAPQGKGSDEARAFSAKLKGELDAEAAARRADEELSARRRADEERVAKQAADARQHKLEADERAAESARAAAADARRRSERQLRISGLASAAAGVIGIGLGIKFGLDARDRERQVSDPALTEWSTALDAAVDDGKSKNLAMEISIAVGSALVVAGGVLVYLGRPSGEVKLAPVVGPGTGGVVVGLEF